MTNEFLKTIKAAVEFSKSEDRETNGLSQEAFAVYSAIWNQILEQVWEKADEKMLTDKCIFSAPIVNYSTLSLSDQYSLIQALEQDGFIILREAKGALVCISGQIIRLLSLQPYAEEKSKVPRI